MGLISGALGGLGQALQQQAQTGMQNDALEQRDIRQTKLREELDAKRAEAIEARRIKSDERNAAIYNEAEQAAGPAGDERRFNKFKTDIGQTDATDEQLRAVFKDKYNQRAVGNFDGADRYVDPESANRQDIVSELRKKAAPATMIQSAQNDYKSQLGAERQATIDALNARKADQADKKEEHRYGTTYMQAQASLNASIAAMKRAEKSGDAQALGDAKTSATQAMNSAREAMANMTDLTKGSIRIENGVPIGSPDAVEQYKDLQKLLRSATSDLNRKFDAKAGGQPPAAGKPITQAEYMKLKPGDTYTAPDGSTRTKGK